MRRVTLRPDWVCEILPPDETRERSFHQTVVYQRNGVPHYWMIDLAAETLAVLRWTADGYLVVLKATARDRVRAEPFKAIELPVGVLFGDDPG